MKRFRPRGDAGWACCLSLLVLMLAACDTGVVESPEPGILRVTMQADPEDDTFVVLGDTVRIVGDSVYYGNERPRPARRPNAYFPITVTQGRAYQDSLFIELFPTLASYQPADVTVNVLRRSDGQPYRYRLYEMLVPPGVYDSLVIGFVPDSLHLVETGQPVRLRDARDPTITFRQFSRDGQEQDGFEVFEEGVTEVELRIRPFRAIEEGRFKDEYRFAPEIEVLSTNYQR